MATATIHHTDTIMCLASDADLGVTLVRRPLTKAQVEPMRRVAHERAALYSNSVRTITVLEPDAMTALIPEEVRRESDALMTGVPSLAIAVVIEGTGFGAATARTLLSGMGLLKRIPSKFKIFATVNEATTWLVTATAASAHGPLSAPRVLALVAAARAAIETPRS